MLVSVTVTTYNSGRFIREALDSVLAQTYRDFELVVVDDGSTDGTPDVVASYSDSRIRLVRKPHGGIPDTYNRVTTEARGELLARLGHDDRMDPHRLELQVAAMRRNPDVGIIHTDATTIDGHGRVIGRWESANYSQEQLTHLFFRNCCNIIDPSTMIRKAVYDDVGLYDLELQMANDFDFWIRASKKWRFLHLPLKLLQYRRHGGNYSDESNKAEERREVQIILERMATRYRTLRELVPEVDWEAPGAERRAREVAHGLLVKRGYPELADKLYGSAAVPAESMAAESMAVTPVPSSAAGTDRQRILMAMYGWAESGGGTILPRMIAKELVQRGHEVMVFYAGAIRIPDQPPYLLVPHEEDGVQLRGLFNRPSIFADAHNPEREVSDPEISEIFGEVLDEFRPDVVHVHNFHNLGISIAAEIKRRHLRAFFSPHNYWLVCPRLYLFDDNYAVCAGPGDGRRCSECLGSRASAEAYASRRRKVRDVFNDSGITCLATAQATRDLLVSNGFAPERVPLLYQGHAAGDRIWQELGAARKPAVPDGDVIFSFIGGMQILKGVHILAAAVQKVQGRFQVHIYGGIVASYRQMVEDVDKKGLLQFHGEFAHEELPEIFARTHVAVIPSVWQESAPTLAAAECLAARVPVIGSNLGGIPELVEDGRVGRIVDGGDIEGLAAALQEVVDRPELVAQWQANIRPPLMFSTYVSELEELYAGRTPESSDESILPAGLITEATGPVTVAWEGDFAGNCTMARLNREVASRLLGIRGFEVTTLSGTAIDPAILEGEPSLAAAQGLPRSRPPLVHVRGLATADVEAPQAGAWVQVLDWDAGEVPREWLAPLKQAVDEVWVGALWQREVLVASGVPGDRVVVVSAWPEGDWDAATRQSRERLEALARTTARRFLPDFLDSSRFDPDIEPLAIDGLRDRNYLLRPDWEGDRWVDALRAYLSAFAPGADVALVVRAEPEVPDATDRLVAAIERIGFDPETIPDVVVVNQELSLDREGGLYRACDVFIDVGNEAHSRDAAACGLEVVPVSQLHALATPPAETTARLPGRSDNQGTGKRILMVMYGWSDSGGGTILPRSIAKELVGRGHQVMVFYAGCGPGPGPEPYHVYSHQEDGVLLRGVYNRPSEFGDYENPEREILDPPILAAFQGILDEFRPDVVHVHNLHNLGAALAEEIGSRNLRAFFTPHNYWLVCPRIYLYHGDYSRCDGPGDGYACAACTGGSGPAEGYVARRKLVRDIFNESKMVCLAVSQTVRDILVTNGFGPDRVKVLYQGHGQADRLWAQVGSRRLPATPEGDVVFSFIGSALPQKGAHLLVEAAQRVTGRFQVRVYGEIGPENYRKDIQTLDKAGVVQFRGKYAYDEMARIFEETHVAVIPSIWYDNAPLAVSECLAARVPVIGANLGGIPEFIQDGMTGRVFDGLRADALAAAMQEIVDRPELVAQWQANIVAPLSFETYLTELETLYGGGEPQPGTERTALPSGLLEALDSPVSVAWEGAQFIYHSLAHVNREVCLELIKAPGVEIDLVPTEDPFFDPREIARYGPLIKAHRQSRSKPPQVHVRHQWPPNFNPPASGNWVMIQPWEFGGIPAEWVVPMREVVDEVWVPSNWVRDCYIKSGVPAEKVVVVPNGVDTDVFRPDGPKYPLETRKAFKFLFLGGTLGRKGIDLLIDAYRAAFTAQDDVCLVIKGSGKGHVYVNFRIEDFLAEVRCNPDAPEIEYIDRELTDEDIAALYRSVDALAHPYRGEGFAMPIAEAMASGLPVVVPDYGACLDFCDGETALLVPATEVGIQFDWLPPASVGYWWAEPDKARLALTLRQIVADPDKARAIGRKARERIVAHYRWDQVAGKYRARILALAHKTPARFSPDFLDPTRFNPDVTPLAIEGLKGQNILLRPDWSDDRWVQALSAYLGAFKPEDDVAMVLRADPGQQNSAERVLAAIEQLGYDPEAIPDIVIVDQTLSFEREGGIYTACQGLLDLGNPIHAIQARACGLAVLAPAPEELRGCFFAIAHGAGGTLAPMRRI